MSGINISISELVIRHNTNIQSFQRGEACYRIGSVLGVTQRGETIQAEVQGSSQQPYQITIVSDSDGLTATCTCAYNYDGWCKHIVAAALTCTHQSDRIEKRPTLSQLLDRLNHLHHSQIALVPGDTKLRSLSQILASAKEYTKLRQAQESETAKQERIRQLLALAPKEAKLWEEVFRLIALKQSKPYDDAVAHLINLRDLAIHQGQLEKFQLRIQQMQTDYSNRPGLLSRLQKVGLLSKSALKTQPM